MTSAHGPSVSSVDRPEWEAENTHQVFWDPCLKMFSISEKKKNRHSTSNFLLPDDENASEKEAMS